MEEEFALQEQEQNFDFKGFVFKVFSYWYIFAISIAVGLGIAYYINVRKLPVYQLSSLISIKDDQNPFFTSNTSLTFNWGGTSDKVSTAVTTLKTRSHNEQAVEELNYYVNYLQEGKYQLIDAYGSVPFQFEVDTSAFQVLYTPLKVVFKDEKHFELSYNLEEATAVSAMRYSDKKLGQVALSAGAFKKQYQIKQPIELPFLKGRLLPNDLPIIVGKPYYIELHNFNQVVKNYQNIQIRPEEKGSSVLSLALRGNNKAKIVDYLNTTAAVLSRNMLDRKNLFATKTIRFIDSSLQKRAEELRGVEDELNDFRKNNSIIDITGEAQQLRDRLTVLDEQEQELSRKLNYFNTLKDYLQSRTDYSNVPAPSVSGIEEPSISSGVGRIVQLSEQRSAYEYGAKANNPKFKDIDRQINATKEVLLENIASSTGLLQDEINSVKRNINQLEAKVRQLPQDEQDLLNIQRRYTISEQTYNLFLNKRNEAGLVKAANVSDVQVIDEAKDVGGGKIGPNTQLNYVMAILLGSAIPLEFGFILVFLDNKVNSVKDVEKLSPISILGMVGKSRLSSNLVVYHKSKSAIAESFRGLRTSLQFIYRQRQLKGCKTVLVTSSISGEGKTFVSMNLASVFAISGKKTLLMGLDLRKPKIFDDFEINNDKGVVNYLINQDGIDAIIQKTRYDNLDVITSGAVPPNPSELLMKEEMEDLIRQLEKRYDYIILDTPPIGLVSDALNLTKFSDANLYIVRQNYTRKGMLKVINEKYKSGEVKNISFVLNYFQQKAKYGYGYGYGYSYGNYGNGYHEPEIKRSWYRRLFKNKK